MFRVPVPYCIRTALQKETLHASGSSTDSLPYTKNAHQDGLSGPAIPIINPIKDLFKGL